jgi:predicted DNA-binding protein (UPF0251 family)
MRSDRKLHLYRAVLTLAQLVRMKANDSGGVGNSEIAQYVGVSRQTVNKVMQEAATRGYVNISLVTWRPGVMAKRYTPTEFYWTECHEHFVWYVNWKLFGDV